MKIKRVLLKTVSVTAALATLSFLAFNTVGVFAAPATFTVTNANDSGAGSLRQAITDANANGNPGDQDSIIFNITGSADTVTDWVGSGDGYTIELASSLPAISENVLIDGLTQTGVTPNTSVSPQPFNAQLRIQIDGSSTDISVESCFIVDGTTDVDIKGFVINSCGKNGIEVRDASNTTIQGNYLGVGPDGIVSLPNGRDQTISAAGNGIEIYQSSNTFIGGAEAFERNIISGNQFSEIFVDTGMANSSNNIVSERTIVKGNYIGLGADGTTVLPCGFGFGHGNSILLTHSFSDEIGGDQPGEGNVISASQEYGVSFRDGSEGALIQGNYFGTDYTGLTPAAHSLGTGHSQAGVSVATVSNGGYTRASNNIQVGGTTSGARNIFMGNYHNDEGAPAIDIDIHDGGFDVSIEGNYIGVGVDGETTATNAAFRGISVGSDSSDVTIGGTTLGARNIVAGYDSLNASAIEISGTDNTILGNYVGLSASGQVLSNYTGLSILGSSNMVGGNSAASRNIISGGSSFNVTFVGFGGGSNNVFQGNCIGTNVSCSFDSSVSNGNGVGIIGGASSNKIGGTGTGEGNVVTGNDNGITLFALDQFSLTPLDNSILGNSIYKNDNHGIELSGASAGFSPDTEVGPSANDLDDVDEGSNDYLNKPLINSVSYTGGQTTINFDLDILNSEETANNYRVEFFASSLADASGFGEGQIYLGSTQVDGDVTSESVTIPTSLSGSYAITATTTEQQESNSTYLATSEFSNALLVDMSSAENGVSGQDDLASTGSDQRNLIIVACSLLGLGLLVFSVRSSFIKKVLQKRLQ